MFVDSRRTFTEPCNRDSWVRGTADTVHCRLGTCENVVKRCVISWWFSSKTIQDQAVALTSAAIDCCSQVRHSGLS
jgi:hypothetical protein